MPLYVSRRLHSSSLLWGGAYLDRSPASLPIDEEGGREGASERAKWRQDWLCLLLIDVFPSAGNSRRMRRRSDAAKVWPLLHRLFTSGSASQTGVLPALLPSPSPRNGHSIPGVFTQRLQSFHGENLRFQHFEVKGQTTGVDPGATDRRWKDTLLSSPGALSVDNEAEHFFITDTHHHRIVIADKDGRVVDCIGSSPGMEDGTFETAQMSYPASTVFDANHNVLYIADSENHVIRRADLSKRTLGTVRPPNVGDREESVWGRFLNWAGIIRPSKSEQEDGQAADFSVLRYPWHLKFRRDGVLLVASRRFEHLWELNPNSGELTEIQSRGPDALWAEFFTEAIDNKEMEGVHNLMLDDMKAKELKTENLALTSSVIDTLSQVVRLHNRLFVLDTEGQLIRRYDLETGSHETLHLSSLGLLGLPWWWSLSSPNLHNFERRSTGDNLAQSTRQENDKMYHQIHIQPGRCLLCINPVLPEGMILAAPLEGGSIWRQAKGSIVELSMLGGSLISHKVACHLGEYQCSTLELVLGVKGGCKSSYYNSEVSSAQQWIDDLDDLDDMDSDVEEAKELTFPQESEMGIPFYSLVDASLGAGEVIIDAVLYLKHADFQHFVGSIKGTDRQHVLQEWVVPQENQIFLKHLHVKVRLEIATSAPEERTKHFTVQL